MWARYKALTFLSSIWTILLNYYTSSEFYSIQKESLILSESFWSDLPLPEFKTMDIYKEVSMWLYFVLYLCVFKRISFRFHTIYYFSRSIPDCSKNIIFSGYDGLFIFGFLLLFGLFIFVVDIFYCDGYIEISLDFLK